MRAVAVSLLCVSNSSATNVPCAWKADSARNCLLLEKRCAAGRALSDARVGTGRQGWQSEGNFSEGKVTTVTALICEEGWSCSPVR